jgi:hypothetical protein
MSAAAPLDVQHKGLPAARGRDHDEHLKKRTDDSLD